MTIKTSAVFDKAYKRRIGHNIKLIQQVKERLILFQTDPKSLLLKNHKLKGTFLGYRAFSITGDIRIVYEQESEDIVTLVDIGSHNQVY